MKKCLIILPLLTVFVFIGILTNNSLFAHDESKALKPPVKKANPSVDAVIATVGDYEIKVADLAERLKRIPPYYKARYASASGKKELLDEIISHELLYMEGTKKKMQQDPEIVERLKSMEKKLVIEKLIREGVQSNIDVSDEAVKAHYEKNKHEFKIPEQVRVSQILVRLKPTATPEDEGKAKTKAEEALKKLKAGSDFAEVAKEYSDDPSSRRGGDMRWVTKGRMHPEFDKVVFTQKEGELSDIFKTKRGFHITKITGRKAESIKSLDRVKGSLKRRLTQEEKRNALDTYREKLKAGVKITIDEKALEQIDVNTLGLRSGAAHAKPGRPGQPHPPLNDATREQLRQKVREAMKGKNLKLTPPTKDAEAK